MVKRSTWHYACLIERRWKKRYVPDRTSAAQFMRMNRTFNTIASKNEINGPVKKNGMIKERRRWKRRKKHQLKTKELVPVSHAQMHMQRTYFHESVSQSVGWCYFFFISFLCNHLKRTTAYTHTLTHFIGDNRNILRSFHLFRQLIIFWTASPRSVQHSK